jgi:excisionase family DNA binding protein
MAEENGEKLLTTQQAADRLGLKPQTLELWRCTKRYDLPYVKTGRLVRYKAEHVEDFIERRTVTSESGK